MNTIHIFFFLVFINCQITKNNLSIKLSLDEKVLNAEHKSKIHFELEFTNISSKYMYLNARFLKPEPDINIIIIPKESNNQVIFLPPPPPKKPEKSDFKKLKPDQKLKISFSLNESYFYKPLNEGNYEIYILYRNDSNPFNIENVWIGELSSNIMSLKIK